MANSTFRVGLIQMSCGPDPDANLEKAADRVREAARQGAQVVCLPELFRAQYFCQREDIRLFDLAEPIPGPSTDRLGAVAREEKVVVIASLFERRAPGLYHNTAAIIEQDGRLAGLYRKMHIPDDPLYYEKFYFTPGDLGFRAFDTTAGRIGTLVCWDQWYPEGARITALQGANVLFYPTAIGWHPHEKEEFGTAQYEAWQTIQRAHAIANGVYVAAVNRVGHEHGDVRGNRAEGPGLEFWGGSFLADPFGRVIARAAHDREEILIGEIDLAVMEDTRRNWPFLRDRRIDAYAPIVNRFLDGNVREPLLIPQRRIRKPDQLVSALLEHPSQLAEQASRKLIEEPRRPADQIHVEPRPGVYALFVDQVHAIPGIRASSEGLIYIGKSNSGLTERNPLFKKDSSFSTFRRSLGAMLKAELNLHAIPRTDGDPTNYQFGAHGEQLLTKWMHRHLTYSFVALDEPRDAVDQIEQFLIQKYCPPLNLTNHDNEFAPAIKKARRECQDEANGSRG